MASFFSTLFGGGAERDAANRNRAALGDYTNNAFAAMDRGLGASTGAVNTGANAARGYYDANSGLYGDMYNTGSGILDRNLTGARDALSGGRDSLSGLASKYGLGTTMYQNSLGLNGAAGTQAAQDAFTAGPGYQFTLDQGLEALNRRRAAAGMLNSGNADIDALKYGTGLANQTYGSWQDRLAGFINPELSATQGAASMGGQLANLYNSDSAARLGLLGTSTAGRAGANSANAANDVALGNTLAGLNSNDANNRVGVYGNVLSGNTAANNMQAQGEASGARNLMNLGIAGAQLAMGMPPTAMMGGGGGGSTAGSFGNLFGGGGTMWGNGTGYATNPWSAGGQFGGR